MTPDIHIRREAYYALKTQFLIMYYSQTYRLLPWGLLWLLSPLSCNAFFEGKKDWFLQSVLAASEANQISAALPEIQRTKGEKEARKKEQEMIRLLRRSIEKSENLDSDFLRTLHPDLPALYFDCLISGQRELLAAIREKDSVGQSRAIRKLKYWGQMWDRLKKVILSKIE